MNSERINKLPLSGARRTTFKLLRGLCLLGAHARKKKKGEFCSVFVVIVGRQWFDQILIRHSASLISVYHRLCWMKFCSQSLLLFFPFLLHHWQLSNNESWMSQCIRRRQGGGRARKKRGFGPLVGGRMEQACERARSRHTSVRRRAVAHLL